MAEILRSFAGAAGFLAFLAAVWCGVSLLFLL